MSKAHRGKGLREFAASGRGDCPLCKRSNVKVVYEQEIDGAKAKICKTCKANLANKAKRAPKPEQAAAPTA